jgi:hypothetical protein
MIKGNVREENNNSNSKNSGGVKHVGLATVELVAVNPTRKEINELLGKENSEEDAEINYLTTDSEGYQRVRLSFWLYAPKLDKYFVHSFNLSEKQRLSRDGEKKQFVSSTCNTAWTDVEDNLPDWFTTFKAKDGTVLGKKEYREALLGEEELVVLLRTWLGRIKWSNPDTVVLVDTKALFKEDFSELRSLIKSDFDTPFVVMLGVKTDDEDVDKQYQQIYGKSFLPNGFAEYIIDGFPSDYEKRIWNKFENEITGEYGFKSYFVLEAAKEYVKDEDPAGQSSAMITPSNSKY